MDFNSRKSSTWLFAGIGILFVVLIILQYFSVQNPDPYILLIEGERERKDLSFGASEASPIKAEERDAFEGLDYFPPNSRYKVEARLTPAAGAGDTLILPTTQGTDYKVIKAGALVFSLQERACTLTAFKYSDPSMSDLLFVPFRDLTSGGSTYGGGRYLDVPFTEDGIEIDFNRSYNPYCVYNETYYCPIPPQENKLMLEILAGEKMYNQE